MRVDPYDLFVKASVTEPTELGKIVMFSTMDMEQKQNVQKNIGKIFQFCDDPDTYLSDVIDQTLPVLLWDKQSLIEKYGISDTIGHDLLTADKVYNAPHGIVVSKLDTLKILKKLDFPWLPKTVFSREDAKKELKFPIIAKASNTYQSRGVEKVSSKTGVDKLVKGFDIFQEQIQIKKEFRIVFFKGKRTQIKMLLVFRRDPLNEKAKSLRVNEAGMTEDKLDKREKSNFSWTQVDPKDVKGLSVKECYHIAKVIFDINPTLNVAGLDIAVDKDGKHFFIESNSTPGLFSNMVPLIYKSIYEDYYGTVSEYAIKRLMQLCTYFVYLTTLDEPSFRTDTNVCINMFGYQYQ
jgi:hypothetical protein